MSFDTMQMEKAIKKALKIQKITEPTKVQTEVYETILGHKDMIVQSETGSGKTLAYLLPLYEKYKQLERTNKVMILVPTQELAMQVHKQVETLSKNSEIPMKSAVIFGNVKIERQIEKLKEKPQFVIGTAGRILELIKKKKIAAHTIKTIVIDEADKLLDVNNIESTKSVIKCTMKDRQLLCFSASMDKKTIEIVKGIAKDAIVCTQEKEKTIPKNIEHMYVLVSFREKVEMLRKLVHATHAKKAMIFQNGAYELEEIVEKLSYHHYKVACIHGGVTKKERQKAIEAFSREQVPYLVATDIAARGLHFEGVDTVFHMSIPEEAMDYQHRAGRTGRNGKKGRSILIVTERELPMIKSYEKKLGIQLVEHKVKEGKLLLANKGISSNVRAEKPQEKAKKNSQVKGKTETKKEGFRAMMKQKKAVKAKNK